MIRELFVLLLSVIVVLSAPSNSCDPNPCQNGGKCYPDSSSYYCSCPSGVYGTKCDKQKCLPRFHYREASDTCIRLVLEARTWYEARKRCKEFQGSYLTIVNNEKEATDQAEYLKSYSTDLGNKCSGRAWVGAQTEDLSCKTPYMWKPNDDDYLTLTYSYWVKSQPDCGDGGKEACAAAQTDASYQWNDLNCENTACFICESGPYQ